MTLRPLLPAFALLALIACSKDSTPAETPPGEETPTEEQESTGTKKPQSTDITDPNLPDGTEVPIDPGTIDGPTTPDTPDTPTEPGSKNGVSNAVSLTDVKITVQGEARHYILAVPKNYDAKDRPSVL